MKGLLIKDFKFIKVQKSFFFVILAVAVSFAIFYDNVSFALGFLAFTVSLFVLTTISYDEFDNGNAFLFTLPISRKDYVISKYVFAVLLGISVWIVATVFSIAVCAVKGTVSVSEELMSAVILFPIICFLQSIMMPFQLKFGAERGRIALLGVIGGFILVGIAFVKIAEMFGLDFVNMADTLPEISMGMFVFIELIIVAIVFVISMKISISIMDKKEF